MDCDIYAIAPHGEKDDWAVDLNGQTLGFGMDQERAQRAARTAARMSQNRGREAVVLTLPAARPLSPTAISAIAEMTRCLVACRTVAGDPGGGAEATS